MGFTRNAAGWTILTPSGTPSNGFNAGTPTTSTNIMYIASGTGGGVTGSDANNGSFSAPYLTLAFGLSKMRDGSPDWLLLANGDTWTNEMFDAVFMDGLNVNERMVFASYDKGDSTFPPIPNPGTGGARPLVKTPTGQFRRGLTELRNYCAAMGLRFYAYTRDPNNAGFCTNLASIDLVLGGINYVAGDTITLTAIDGTTITPAILTVATTGGGGAITSFTILYTNTGAFGTLTPPTGFIQGSTSGLGTGATFTNPVCTPMGIDTPGMGCGGVSSNTLIEDCYVSYFHSGIEMNPDVPGAVKIGYEVRRCIAEHTYDTEGKVSVGYHTANSQILFEECIADQCGWDPIMNPTSSTLNHNWYLSANNTNGIGVQDSFVTDLTFKGNINSRDLYESQIRCGGYLYNNLWICGDNDAHNYGFTLPTAHNLVDFNVYVCSQNAAMNDVIEFGGGGNPDTNGGFWNLCTAVMSRNLFIQGFQAAISVNTVDIVGDPGGANNLLTLTNNISWKVGNVMVSGDTTISTGYNAVDQTGTNSGATPEPYPDPNRSIASYYATLSGSSPNATFTASITAGVLDITSISGTVARFDAITWPGQTKADYIDSFGTGAGTTGNYNLASKTGLSPANSGSQSMSSYNYLQFITLYKATQSKQTWRTDLMAASVNTYIRAGFGISDAASVVSTSNNTIATQTGVYRSQPTKIPNAKSPRQLRRGNDGVYYISDMRGIVAEITYQPPV